MFYVVRNFKKKIKIKGPMSVLLFLLMGENTCTDFAEKGRRLFQIPDIFSIPDLSLCQDGETAA